MACVMMSPSPSFPNGHWRQIQAKKEIAGENVKAIICFFPDIRGGLVGWWGIMEARKPDRQGRPASLLASSLPRFISYCHVAAWPGLLRPVCVCLCALCVHVAMWVRPEKMVEAIQASRSYIQCECDGCHPDRPDLDVMLPATSAGLTGHIPILYIASSDIPSALFSPVFYLFLSFTPFQLC